MEFGNEVVSPTAGGRTELNATLKQIEDRVLWLSTAMIDHANRVRPNSSGLKVGGHQASSSSVVTISTALFFEHLRAEDRISMKPHASPILHSIEFLMGQLDLSYMTRLREFGGLQSYPSRTKDPIPADYSTGSVGIGATAPIWGAIARRYVDTHCAEQQIGRQYSMVGDAELDEGAIWEAVFDPMVSQLGEVIWIIDFNRQSLDRVLPILGSERIEAIFGAAGWQVLTVKFGVALTALFERPGGHVLRQRIEDMSNEEYQRLLRRPPAELVTELIDKSSEPEVLRQLLAHESAESVAASVRGLGGHDFDALRAAFAAIDDSRPTVIIAYTIKGYGLPTEGHPQNHSALLKEPQVKALGHRVGMSLEDPWQKFSTTSPEGELCAAAAVRLNREETATTAPPVVPKDLGRTPAGVLSTQAALGRTLLDLARAAPEVGSRIVTVAPDVSSSTNLGGWVNKFGVWSDTKRQDWFSDDGETLLHWDENPDGRHIELGIAETNLVGLIGELGATWSRWGQPLFPIGTVYDPFVARALEPWAYGIYAGGQSILVGTPSGATLAPEGGAHQSVITPSIGVEQPGCTSWEPAFALDTEWCLLEALSHLGKADGESAYLRLSTRPVNQMLADVPSDAQDRERRRTLVVAGAYVLRRADKAKATIACMGAVMPTVLEALELLSAGGLEVDVVCVTSADLLFRAHQARSASDHQSSWILDEILPADRRYPLVTVLDGHPHTLAFLANITRTRSRHLGVTQFGQSGDLESLYSYHGIDAQSIANAVAGLVGPE